MSDVSERPSGAKAEDPSIDPPLPPLAFDDAPAVRAWLTFLREHLLDALAVGEDAARSPRERMFSRYEVRRRLAHEERVLLGLVDAGERGLPALAERLRAQG
jgi:hypothetical protein